MIKELVMANAATALKELKGTSNHTRHCTNIIKGIAQMNCTDMIKFHVFMFFTKQADRCC